MKQKWTELQENIDKHTDIARDLIFNIPFSITNRTENQLSHRRLEHHYQAAWSNWHLQNIPTDHTLSHKRSLNKCRRIEVIPSMFYQDDDIKWEISNWKLSGISPNIQKLYTLLNNSWVKDEIKSEIRKYFELTANKDTTEERAVNTKVLREKHAGNRPVWLKQNEWRRL